MSAGRSASVYLIFCFLLCSSEALENIKAVVGQDVILPCKVNNNNNIIAVEWNRDNLDPEYVFLYRDGHFDPKHLHPSYQNRVDLKDKEMKDGDVSMILKDVKMEDRGTYECRVFHEETNLINIIHLDVGPSGDKDGGDKDGGDKDGGDKDGISLGVVGLILLLVASVGFLIYRHKRQNSNLHDKQML